MLGLDFKIIEKKTENNVRNGSVSAECTFIA